jgi:integrase
MAQRAKSNLPRAFRTCGFTLRPVRERGKRGPHDGRLYWCLLDLQGQHQGQDCVGGVAHKDEAQDEAARQLLASGEPTAQQEPEVTGYTVGEVCRAWLAWRQKQSIAPDTLVMYRSTIRRLNMHFKHLSRDGLDSDAVTTYLDARRSGAYGRVKVREGTLTPELTLLRAAWNWGRRQGIVDAEFPEVIHRVKASDLRAVTIPSEDDARLVVAALPDGWPRAVGVLLFATGARPTEIYRLAREDLDLAGTVVHYRATKNGRARDFPIGPNTVALLRAHLPSEGPLWGLTLDGLRSTFRKHLAAACQQSRFDTFTPKAFRVLMDVRLAKAGDIHALEQLMGHSAEVAVKHYLRHRSVVHAPVVDL